MPWVNPNNAFFNLFALCVLLLQISHLQTQSAQKAIQLKIMI